MKLIRFGDPARERPWVLVDGLGCSRQTVVASA